MPAACVKFHTSRWYRVSAGDNCDCDCARIPHTKSTIVVFLKPSFQFYVHTS